MHNFYFLTVFQAYVVRYDLVEEIIRGKYHRCPLNVDVYVFMSKDCRIVKWYTMSAMIFFMKRALLKVTNTIKAMWCIKLNCPIWPTYLNLSL